METNRFIRDSWIVGKGGLAADFLAEWQGLGDALVVDSGKPKDFGEIDAGKTLAEVAYLQKWEKAR